jgi:2-polyprenyl-3-methyl-5-hydroxy-6-metoxy-1,4-benzoquinol methylase
VKKDVLIDKYCKGKGLEIGGADNCVEGINTLKTDNKTDYFNKNYIVDYILDATDLHVFEDNKFDFVITIHVL